MSESVVNKSARPVYYFGGPSGVGKTTLLKNISLHLPEVEVRKGSAELMKWLGLNPGDYRSLQNLPDTLKTEEQNKMFHSLIANRDKPLVLDTHYLLTKQEKTKEIASDWLGEISAFVLVWANASQLLERIKKDELTSGGDRRKLFLEGRSDAEKLGVLGRYLDATRARAKHYANQFERPLLEIENRTGGLEDAVKTFVNFHTNLTQTMKA